MNAKMSPSWVPLEKIELFVQLEPAILILGLAFGAWLGAKFFLNGKSEERQRSFSNLFRNLGIYLGFGFLFYLIYTGLHSISEPSATVEKVTTYVGFFAILIGATAFVKTWRIIVLEYLYLSHRSVAFPVLLVNLFTLLLSIVLMAWIGSEIFNIHLAPILATSAIFSLILGLALQDTLGNLFAGVALQFDKPYEIGDWIEVHGTGQKWVGQVHEISWRATVLVALSEEFITLPNRLMSQAEISNFNTKVRPIARSLTFRLPFHADSRLVKEILTDAAKSTHEIRKKPSPRTNISETNESWITYRLVYFLDNYGTQFLIADQVYSRAIQHLKAAGVELAGQRVIVRQEQQSESSEAGGV